MSELKKTENASTLPKNIGQPAIRALSYANITHLEQLTKVSEEELLKMHGVGPKAIRLLKEALASNGLAFAEPGHNIKISEEANKRMPRRNDNG